MSPENKKEKKKTPEAKEKKINSGDRTFVVQKHDATNLHYDFRLEDAGVLKSWAVPKGPSMNPEFKRLAVMVEDHPLDYASFHGEIPEGSYGAGTVDIWDHGTWEPFSKNSDVEKALKKGLLEFTLHGKKLRGGFVLIRTDGSYAKNGWLLKKLEDKYSVEGKYDANLEPVETL